MVVGDEECGKTSLLNTLVKSPDYEVSLHMRSMVVVLVAVVMVHT